MNTRHSFSVPTAVQVFFACATGGWIGALVVRQFHFFWWLGLLAGATVGYLTYELPTVVRAVPRAWNAAHGWKMYVSWREWATGFLYVLGGVTSWMFMLFYPIMMHPSPDSDIRFVDQSPLAFSVLMSVVLTVPFSFCCLSFRAGDQSPKQQCADLREWFVHLNPVSVLFWYIPRILLFCFLKACSLIRRAPSCLVRLAGFFSRFAWRLFLLIHSEIRVLCMTDAAVGTLVGHVYGNNALVGFLAGGVAGVLNYAVLSCWLLRNQLALLRR